MRINVTRKMIVSTTHGLRFRKIPLLLARRCSGAYAAPIPMKPLMKPRKVRGIWRN